MNAQRLGDSRLVDLELNVQYWRAREKRCRDPGRTHNPAVVLRVAIDPSFHPYPVHRNFHRKRWMMILDQERMRADLHNHVVRRPVDQLGPEARPGTIGPGSTTLGQRPAIELVGGATAILTKINESSRGHDRASPLQFVPLAQEPNACNEKSELTIIGGMNAQRP